MDVTTATAIVLSLLHLTLGRPLELALSEQITDSTELDDAVSSLQRLAEEKSAATDSPKYISSQIMESNKGSSITLLQGDIRMQLSRSAMWCNQCIWPSSSSGTINVPFVLAPEFSDSQNTLIREALQEFNTLTCIQFTDRTMETDYLNISSGNGCYSFIGKTGGAQYVSLDKMHCMSKGIIQHEIEHSLGFYHEHTRNDRDQYVDILWNNIVKDDWGSFVIQDSNTLGLPYDYESVMHYDRYTSSITPGQPSIVPKPDPTVAIGQRYGLSNLDVAKVNKLYNCNLCSTLLSDPTGTVQSSNNPSSYPNNINCVYLIRVPSDKILLQFDAFDLQSSPNCASDYLTIYDGNDKEAPVLLKKACGTGQLLPFTSSGNEMLLEFVTDGSITASGFKASYSNVKCGGPFTSSPGTVSSPYFPNVYHSSTDCDFYIMAPAGYKVSLTFTSFAVEPDSDCAYDSLSIFDGAKTTSPLIGKYCGSNLVPPVTSTGSSLLLQFHSDVSLNMKGFQATYTFVRA